MRENVGQLRGRGNLTLLVAGGFSGTLYSLSIPSIGIAFLAWFCLVPALLCVMRRNTPPGAGLVFIGGLVCGMAAGIGRIYWISETLVNYGGLNQMQALASTAALVLYLALYPALFLVICRSLPSKSPFFSWLAAAVWVLLDWAQSWILTGFPWQQIGYSQHRNLPVLQFASVAGIYGLSFAVVLANSAVAQAILLPGRILFCACPVLAAVIGLVAFGNHRLATVHAQSPAAEHARVGVIQGSIPQDAKWKADRQRRTTDHYIELTREFMAENAGEDFDLIIFPETALPYYLTDPFYDEYRDRVAGLARQLDTPILVGSLEGRREVAGNPIYNRAFLVGQGGELVDFADKVHLVPFGEYLPLPEIFSYLDQLTAESGRFTHGDSHRAIQVPEEDLRLGVFICYESIFPEITRTLALDEANLLINTTNDAWFGYTSAPYQHMAMAAVRAVECGLPLVRAANTGISGAVAPSGRILEATDLFETTAISISLPPPSPETFYVRHGDVLLLLCAAGLAIALAIGRRRHEAGRNRARAELARFAADPRPLARPLVLLHGYDSSERRWKPFLHTVRRCFTNADTQVVFPDLNRDRSLAELVAEVPVPPDAEADYVGHSLGGLVAVQKARDNSRSRVFALSTPFRGTWVAAVSRLSGCRFPRLLADLIPGRSFPGSTELSALADRVECFRIDGDPVVSAASARIQGSRHRAYSGGWELRLFERHRAVISDPRVMRDIVEALRES